VARNVLRMSISTENARTEINAKVLLWSVLLTVAAFEHKRCCLAASASDNVVDRGIRVLTKIGVLIRSEHIYFRGARQRLEHTGQLTHPCDSATRRLLSA
jgi:hypothetical protein